MRPTRFLAALAALAVSTALAGGSAAGSASAAPVDATAPAVAPDPSVAASNGLSWRLLDTGGVNHYRGLAAVDRSVAWVSGYDGQVLRTVDGGATWTDVSPTGLGTETLQFRDIAAVNRNRAVVMAAGEGTDSRLIVTTDGGVTWTTSYQNTEPAAFFDCMAFSDADHGLVMSDPVDGRFRILETSDGGRRWQVVPPRGMPVALTGEFGFAASGQCITTSGRDAWFGTGGGRTARIFHSTDGGQTWSVTTAPLRSTESGGVFGLAFSTPSRGVVVGGDFAAPTARTRTSATQLVGGPWQPSTAYPTGYRSGVTFMPGTAGTVIAVGLTGSDLSTDGGRTWTRFDRSQFDTVTCTTDGACWAAGDKGRVAVLRGL